MAGAFTLSYCGYNLKRKKNASQIVFKLQPLDQVCRSVQSACLVLREALGANSGIKKERHRVKGS